MGLQVITELLDKIKFNQNEMKKAVESSYSTATDLADWLVKNINFTFRKAYNLTGQIVSYAIKNDLKLDELSIQELQKFDKKINKNVFLVLSPLNSMKAKTSFGGTSPENVKKSIKYAIKKYL